MKNNNISEWLENFKTCWINKDINSLMSLFTDNVEYYETPFQKLIGKEKVSEVWQEIKAQENINLELELYCSEKNKHAVKWELDFISNGQSLGYRGVYLIELDRNNTCFSFYQCSCAENQ